tara:strand:- start:15 stop:497 length:483 start_codon:yes stop_codon:yes gene_type:complete
MQKKTQKKIIIISSLLIYIISFTQNAISANGYDGIKYYSSLATFLSGGFGVFGGAFYEWLIWLANPIFFIAIYLFLKDKKKSKILSFLAVTIGLIFTQWKEILANEGGTKIPIVSLDIGYWLWIISFVIFYIGTLFYFSTGKAELKKINTKHNTVSYEKH